MSMKSYKVSGLDSFQPIFFKMYWEVVGDDVWKFFDEGIIGAYSYGGFPNNG